MDLISVRELFKNTSAYAGKEVTVGGWVRSVRASKQFGFMKSRYEQDRSQKCHSG